MTHIVFDMSFPEAFWPFDGDGRTKVAPTPAAKELHKEATPLSMTRGFARTLIERFNKDGHIVLEKTGAAVWVIEAWAACNGIETAVIKHPFGGWYIKQTGYVEEEEEEDLIDAPDDSINVHADAHLRSRILV